MNVPVELIVWGLVGLTAVGGGALHLLIRINNGVREIREKHNLTSLDTKYKLESLDRHQRRNSSEIAQLRRHLNLPTGEHA